MDETPRANRLIYETSPYLLQHAHNPVDWYPWGEEALQRARAEDRPILLSVGYSACHWCHVMAHESFEDAATAAVMNEHFVNIKVDREERPDVDAIYMEAVQALTGQGGWPMTVFLQPDGLPFYGGTYFPPVDRHGLPAFRRVLLAVAESYRERRDQIRESAAELRAHLGGQLAASATGEPNVQVLDEAVRNLDAAFDEVHGGLGGAPKFPQPSHWEFLLRAYHRTGDPQALAMVEKTLLAMAHGGIYDQLGGGFHRYAMDERWLVPHFEKMLYDNAQLATLYLHAYQVTGNSVYRTVVEETLDYVAREMTAPDGGFYSSQDADSEGHEGRFFVWNLDEARAVLAGAGLDEQDARLVLDHYGITARGNFEGQNILSVPREPAAVAATAGVARSHLDEAVARGRQALFAARETRVRPGRDDKILTAWNGLMLRAFAEAGAVLDRDDYRRLARRNAAFLLEQMRESNGRLRRVFKDGTARLNGYLEDYAFLADGLLALYVATFELPYYRAARELAGAMVDHFWDAEEPGFYTTSDDHEALILRPRAMLDNAVPAGSSVAVEVLLRLAAYTGDERFAAPVEAVLRALAVPLGRYPAALSRLLGALESYAAPPPEIALIGDPEDPALQRLAGEVYRRFEPAAAVALARGPHDVAVDEIPLLAGRVAIDGRAAAYVCRHFICLRPATTPHQLAEQLEAGQ